MFPDLSTKIRGDPFNSTTIQSDPISSQIENSPYKKRMSVYLKLTPFTD